MPGMAECRGHDAFCNAAGAGFEPFCSAAGISDALPPMRMYFHTGTYDLILFRRWVPTAVWQYALSCLAIVAMGVVVQGVRVRPHPARGAPHRLRPARPRVGLGL